MRTELAPFERESIGRVLGVLEAETNAMIGTELAVLWADWQEALDDLREGRAGDGRAGEALA